jgi:hypothetical protein
LAESLVRGHDSLIDNATPKDSKMTKTTALDASIANLQSLGFSNEYIIDGLKAGINDCQRFIDKEGPRDAALRPEREQQHLDYCISHKKALEQKIASLSA